MLDSAARPRTEVGALAAEYLRENVSTDARVGIAWSRSTQALVEHLHDLPRCTIVQLCGVIDHAAGEEQNVQLMRRAALFAKRGAVAETCGILIAGDGRPLRDGLQSARSRLPRRSCAAPAMGSRSSPNPTGLRRSARWLAAASSTR